MRRVVFVGLLFVLGAPFAPLAKASDPVGVYAVLERVELEPNAAYPDRVKLYGWFAVANRTSRLYDEPRHGWLYFSLKDDKADLCRREWKDLEELAGNGKCVAFGGRYGELGKVVKKKDRLAAPVAYPIAAGLFNVRSDTDSDVIRGLVSIPLAVSPTEDSVVPPGRIELKAVNTRGAQHQKAEYVFDLIELKSGARLRSDPIPAGDRQTTWTSKLKLKPGERYAWQVEAVDGDWKVRSAETEFVAKAAP